MISALLRALLSDRNDSRVRALEDKVRESERKIENLTKSIDILIKFGEEVSSNMNVIASHVLVMRASMGDVHFSGGVPRRGDPSDDDLIN